MTTIMSTKMKLFTWVNNDTTFIAFNTDLESARIQLIGHLANTGELTPDMERAIRVNNPTVHTNPTAIIVTIEATQKTQFTQFERQTERYISR